MKSAEKWYNWFVIWAGLYLFLFFVALLLPQNIDHISIIVLRFSTSIAGVLISISALYYYKWLLRRETTRVYKIKWTYRDKERKPLIQGTMCSKITGNIPTKDRGYINSKAFSKYLNTKHKHNLCNGYVTVEGIEYLGKEYTN